MTANGFQDDVFVANQATSAELLDDSPRAAAGQEASHAARPRLRAAAMRSRNSA